jgi:DNA-binding NtrC family response regulator
MTEASKEFEKQLIAKALKESEGNITKAAKRLDIDPVWVRRKISEHGLEDLARS